MATVLWDHYMEKNCVDFIQEKEFKNSKLQNPVFFLLLEWF